VVKTKNIYYEIDLANEHIINKAASISHQEAFDSSNIHLKNKKRLIII
jgi:hypothetical protein